MHNKIHDQFKFTAVRRSRLPLTFSLSLSHFPFSHVVCPHMQWGWIEQFSKNQRRAYKIYLLSTRYTHHTYTKVDLTDIVHYWRYPIGCTVQNGSIFNSIACSVYIFLFRCFVFLLLYSRFTSVSIVHIFFFIDYFYPTFTFFSFSRSYSIHFGCFKSITA